MQESADLETDGVRRSKNRAYPGSRQHWMTSPYSHSRFEHRPILITVDRAKRKEAAPARTNAAPC